jgi:dipeptidyl aminopeptidase/acylaminoacyl peptidase
MALAIAALVAATASVAAAAATDRLTVERAMSLRAVADVAISPDAADIAYRIDRPRRDDEPRGGAVGELWTMPARGGTPAPLEGAGFNARQPRWSPDGKRLAWLAQADPDGAAQIFIRERAGGAATIVTQQDGGIGEFAWSPDSTRIGYTAWDAATEAQLRDRRQGRDWILFGAPGPQLRLYVIRLTDRQASLVTRAELTVHHFDWSPDGTRFVIGAAPTASEDDRTLRVQPYVVSATGGEPRLLAKHFGRLTYTRWSADGKWVAWLASTTLTDPWAGSVFALSLEPGAQPKNLTSGFEASAKWLGSFSGSPGTLAFLADERQRTVLYTVDLATGRRRALNTSEEIVSGVPSLSRDARVLAVSASTAAHPDEVFVADLRRGPGSLRRLTDSNAWLTGTPLGAQTVERWRSKDGLEIEGVMIKPAGFQPGTRYPVVVHVHGGSESVVLDGWHGSYIDLGQLLAARGYVVIYPNYRGSRGRGVEFVQGNRRDVMGREWEDIEAALDHVIATGIGDRERAGIYGFSWGGYAAGWGATFASHRFKAAVAGAGIYNWISEAGSNDTRMHEQLAHWDAPLYEHFGLYLERSPIYEIRKANTPVLLLHGQLDESCPVGQAIEFHTALRWKGVPVELVIYPREGHGMDEPAHQHDFVTRGLEWFDRYLPGSAR